MYTISLLKKIVDLLSQQIIQNFSNVMKYKYLHMNNRRAVPKINQKLFRHSKMSCKHEALQNELQL